MTWRGFLIALGKWPPNPYNGLTPAPALLVLARVPPSTRVTLGVSLAFHPRVVWECDQDRDRWGPIDAPLKVTAVSPDGSYIVGTLPHFPSAFGVLPHGHFSAVTNPVARRVAHVDVNDSGQVMSNGDTSWKYADGNFQILKAPHGSGKVTAIAIANDGTVAGDLQPKPTDGTIAATADLDASPPEHPVAPPAIRTNPAVTSTQDRCFSCVLPPSERLRVFPFDRNRVMTQAFHEGLAPRPFASNDDQLDQQNDLRFKIGFPISRGRPCRDIDISNCSASQSDHDLPIRARDLPLLGSEDLVKTLRHCNPLPLHITRVTQHLPR
ncbi:MAG TPA: hypothetical protein VE172_15040 [Stackebrandtia sp.]|uniref:hypothetical protein n=1 Tax=Stackebrandtia sp. TaxID=2023065 RepID=UPI002D69CB17|nr:hypothetical protein [Stackebrandtia sp.]HZE40121.1 hypothetical protein [Stackebrandtia sp.]